MTADPATRFQRSLISDLDEPVQRFFTHAIRDGAALGGGMRLMMTGRIKVGIWLPFTAEQTVDEAARGPAMRPYLVRRR